MKFKIYVSIPKTTLDYRILDTACDELKQSKLSVDKLEEIQEHIKEVCQEWFEGMVDDYGVTLEVDLACETCSVVKVEDQGD